MPLADRSLLRGSSFRSNSSLALSVTYRLNADFSIEDIETLLSSRFIDEDFFRPTVDRFHSAAEEGRVRSLLLIEW